MVISEDNYRKVTKDLEQMEVTKGGLSNTEFAQLLISYMIQNDLTSARYLWKRIPMAAKVSFSELEIIWKIGKAMNKKEYAEIYESFAYAWSSDIAHLMQALKEEFQCNTLKLISKAYTTLEISGLCKYLGCDAQTAVSIAQKNGWNHDNLHVYPTMATNTVQDTRSEHNAFEKLTDSISFLEN